MKKIRVVAVSYLNTKPLLYGLLRSPLAEHLDLQLQIPSVCASMLKRGEADMGLVPVAIIPELSQPQIISDYCIGTQGTVRTVCLFSERPLEELDTLLLDYHSRTSVVLTQYLLREYWRLSPVLTPAYPGYESDIKDRTGGLIIGDRAIGMEDKYPFVYDLGEAWLAHTGLPFVFAAWVSNGPMPETFVQAFNEALRHGLDHIPELLYLLPSPVPGFDLHAYFTENIRYELDEPKRRALSLFLQELGLGQVSSAAINSSSVII
jgi:chorismate dehydratase